MIAIEPQQTQHLSEVLALNRAVFGGEDEVWLVDALLASSCPTLSLVALEDGQVLGHILFSQSYVHSPSGNFLMKGMALAPMCVLPTRQNQGIGSRLVETGIELVGQSDAAYVNVLGHTGFYPRFGFVPAIKYGIGCQWVDAPTEAFMMKWFSEPPSDLPPGCVIRYHEIFDKLMES